MIYRLYRFDHQPPEICPEVGMNEMMGMGHYLNATNAMRYFRKGLPKPPIRMFNSGKPATHLGLYDWNDKLVHTETV